MRILILFAIGLVSQAACCSLACVAAAAEQAERPNVVAIVTDDQGRWAMGGYGNGQVHTPHMDRIAAEGALFENAFTVTPVCSPSRATYMSGRWPTQLGITDWISPPEANAGVGLKAATWPEVLKAAGYRTGMVGKWHLGTKPEYHPKKLGFDHFMGFLGGGNRPMNPTLEVDGQERQLEGALPDLLVDDAIDFVKQNRSGPFALCLHFRAPHLPYGPVPEEDLAHYQSLDIEVPDLPGLDVAELKRTTRDYYASISSVDRNIGRLLAMLDELKLADNTLVVFTSDHGYNEGRHYVKTKGNASWMAGGVRGPMRPNMWDTSMRIPLAMRWPRVIKPGTRIADHMSNLDTFRTMLGAVGVEPPADCQALGVDCSPLLRGKPLPPRNAIYGQYDLHNSGLAYMRMIRTPKWKLVKYYKANHMDELYDLENDPDETRNLLRGRAARTKVAERLEKQLVDWQRSIDDPVLKAGY